MTRIGPRLIEDFLLPALNDGRYGDLLKWVDREKCHFSIRWSHKNAANWTLADIAVFQDWDKLKGHYHPEIKGYYMQAKQRFRAALYKLNTVRKLPCEDKHVKKYQLVLNKDKRHRPLMTRKVYPKWIPKEENQKSIPTPVICRNTSFIAKPEPEESCSSPPSPVGSIKCELEELQECLEDYQIAQEQQLKLSELDHKKVQIQHFDCPSSVLRESPQNNIVRRTPHVPIQPVPVYSSKSRQAIQSAHKRYESPHVLLVQTYNDTDMGVDGPPIKVIKEEIVLDSNMSCSENENNSDGALNLCVKSDGSIAYSR